MEGLRFNLKMLSNLEFFIKQVRYFSKSINRQIMLCQRNFTMKIVGKLVSDFI
jgi:hypothetical protein